MDVNASRSARRTSVTLSFCSSSSLARQSPLLLFARRCSLSFAAALRSRCYSSSSLTRDCFSLLVACRCCSSSLAA
ncbi:hypothetical protein S245_005284, partial [Arachis hypogaea]